MRVVLSIFLLLGLVFAHEEFDPYAEGLQLERECDEKDGMITLKLYHGGQSVQYYTIGDSNHNVHKCYIDVVAPKDHGIVMAVEYYASLTDESDMKRSSDCNSFLDVSYNQDGSQQKSKVCLNNVKASNIFAKTNVESRSAESVVLYSLFSSYDNFMTAKCETSDDEAQISYGLVFTAVRKSKDCYEDVQCVPDGSPGTPHCAYHKLRCDGHVNCASTPFSDDEQNCSHNIVFYGEDKNAYLYFPYWYLYAIFSIILILLLIALLVCLVRMGCRTFTNRNRRQQSSSTVAIVTVPSNPQETPPEKSSLPPDYSSIEELPPAYHSLFFSLDKPAEEQQQQTNQRATTGTDA